MKILTVPNELIEQKALKNEKIYLSDLDEFKDNNLSILYNTVFNKGVTGIGGTSLALDSKENIIIVMPFVEVVNNKEGYNEDVFTVKEGVTIAAIKKYLKTTPVRKIVSTYDGLSKILEAYKAVEINPYDDFLLVDEWQVIFNQYGLRLKVMKYLLEQSTLFSNKCFMTATPIKKDYWFKELKGLEELVLEYDIEPTIVKHFKSRNVIDEVIAIINSKDSKNLHFFINSVDMIKSVIKTLNIDKSDVRIICSKQEKNEYKLSGYDIESTKDPVKPINFYTSTCFEGCDIFDRNGQIFVICNGNKAHSLVDISTTLPQIAGRIRDIEDGTINLIYSSSRYIDITEEEFNKKVDENIQKGRNIIEEVKSKDTIEVLSDWKINDRYLIIEDDKLIFEEVLLNVDKANFETSKTYSFKTNLNRKLNQSDKFYSVIIEKPWAEEYIKFEEEKFNSLSFKEKCLLYANLSDMTFSYVPDFPKEVIEAVDILGIDKLEELDYHKGNINKYLVSRLNTTDEMKVMKLLKLTKGEFYKSSDLKNKLTDIYKVLKLNKAAKATDIKTFYEVKETSKRIDNKVYKGYIIITPKIIFK
ncbi:hypothetical protein [Proteiniphilum acetatigenes]|uniref:hypothetical protein n=1 Tax=Proteiniphilum acetatigenes TaxID=294710 RepID=UPI00035E15EE|nr:hypothetical protein [Proteiniphilum acetatigenes]